MIIVLEEKHKQDLLTLSEYDVEVASQFCNVAIDFIRKGENSKLFATAARKLGINADIIAGMIMSLAYLFADASKHNLSETEFVDSLFILQFNDSLVDILKKSYISSKDEIRNIISDTSFDLPHYLNLDWRLDIELSSRSLREQIKPVFIMKLDTEYNGKKQQEILQTDYTNLKYIQQQLEEALEELKEPYSIRVKRNM